MSSTTAPTRLSRRLAVAGALCAVVGASIAAAVMVATGGSSKAAPQPAPGGTATTVVQRRDLVETDIQTGTLGYCGSLNVYGRLAGTVTWLPRAGAVVHPDHALYQVEGSGVYLFGGTQPARRAFHSGMSDGADVGQLNRDLRAMGYDPGDAIELNNAFSGATEAAIKRWQAAHALKQTGEIELGRVVFQPGPRRIEQLDVSLGASATPQAGPSTPETTAAAGAVCSEGSARSATSRKATLVGTARPSPTSAIYLGGARPHSAGFSPPSATATPTTSAPTPAPPAASTPPGTGTTPAPSPPQTGTTSTPPPTTKPAGSGGQPTKPGSSPATPPPGTKPGTSSGSPSASSAGKSSTPSSSSSTSGKSVGSGEPNAAAPGIVLVTTSLQRVVTVPLEAAKQAEARAGESVKVTLPSTHVVDGHIEAVAGAASAGSASSSSSGSAGSAGATVNVEITLDHSIGGAALDQAPVSVAFAARRQNDALSIPVTALVATASGGYAVEEVRGTTRKLVPVTPGIYAGGYVAITGVSEGTVVTNASQ